MTLSTSSSEEGAGRRTWSNVALRALLFIAVLLLADRGTSRLLTSGLEHYFGLRQEAAVVCIGHSRMVLGIDSDLLATRLEAPVAKYAVRGANLVDRRAMLEQFLAQAPRPPAAAVYSVSALLFDGEGLASRSYRLFLPFATEPVIHQLVAGQPGSETDLRLCRALRSTCWETATVGLSLRGHLGLRTSFKRSEVDLERLRRRIDQGRALAPTFSREGFRVLEETVGLAAERSVPFVLVYIPTLEVMNDLDRAAHDEIVARMEGLAKSNDTVWFLDYNADLESRHDLFTDGIHLNVEGQRIVTERLSGDLRRILGPDLAAWQAAAESTEARLGG